MKKIYFLFIAFFCFLGAFAQTNPIAQNIPYAQDFGSLVSTSTTYPDGWQGWTLATTNTSSFRTNAPTGDKALTASGTAASNSGNVYNFNGKIGFLTTGALDLALALAINTTGKSGISVSYDAMTIRNPYDGTTNTRINEMTLQYRVGTSGTFTTLTGIEYQNNTVLQTSGTTPENVQTKTIILPSACENQPVVQLRWVNRDVSGSGSRASFAVDNISISSGATVSSSASVTAGINAAEPSTNGTFSVNLSSPAPAGGVTVTYSLGGTASINSDYTDPQSGSISIAEGSSSATITINVVDDNVFELTKTVSVTLTNASNGYTIGTSTASINLTDNDVPPPVSLTGIYSQNFNSLAGAGTGISWIDAVTIPGWYSSRTTYNAGTGSSSTGALYSFGSDAGDRALGSVGSGTTGTVFYGVRFVNNTGAAITSLKVVYSAEEWRNGGTGTPQTVNFAYQTGASVTSLTAGSWTNVSNLNFSSPVSGTTSGSVDGNAASILKSFSITGLNIPVGSELFLRWEDIDHTGADDGLAIDDLSVEANPADPNPPVISSLSPANGATNVSTNFSASIVFDEPVQKAAGTISIKRASDNSLIQTIDVSSDLVAVSSAVVSINITGLTENTPYYFEISQGAFKDLAGNDFDAISGSSAWSFTTGNIFYTAGFQACSSSLSDGFSQFSETGAVTWACTSFGRDPGAPSGTAPFPYGVQINGFSGGTNVPNVDWLISPSFNLTSTTYPLLSFWSRTAFNGLPLQLKVSTDYAGGDPRLATWTDINGKFPLQTSNVWTLSSNINLSAFKQSNVHFAFVYTSTSDDGARWTVDDISIENSATPPPPSLTVGLGDIQFGFVANGGTSDKTFRFVGNDLTDAVTVTSDGAFQVSKDGISFNSSINYSIEEANNLNTQVYVRFAPAQDGQNFSGTITVSTSELSQTITTKGTSIDPATTLEVVNWNMEWFGSPTLGPADDDQQELNAQTILQNISADVFGLVEVVDESRLQRIVDHMPGYSYVIGNFGSHVNPPDPNGGSLGDAQKLAFVYKTSMFSNVTTRPLINNQDISSTSYNNWSSGRYPFLMTADVTLNGITKTINFVLIHAKANTSPTATSYARRQASAQELHDTLATYFANDNIIMLGDFNDDLDQSITAGFTTTSYSSFTTDPDHFYSPTLALSLAGKKSTVSFNDMIDHVMLSNEMQPWYMSSSATVLSDVSGLVSNYGTTTSDHYPVFTRYMFCKLTCPSDTTVSNEHGQCGAIVRFNAGSTMACGTVTAVPASGSFFPIGTTVVNVMASTGETCSFKVTVKDTELPVITAPGNLSINTDAGQCGAALSSINLGTPDANDNCGGFAVTNDAPASFSVGTTTVTWTVTDASGNKATATQTVTVSDNEAPSVTPPSDVTVNAATGQCSAVVAIGTPATSDNCGVASVSNDAPADGVFEVGQHEITWTVTDVHGNTSTATQTVTVIDDQLPQIISCPAVPVFCYNASGNYTIPALKASDNCGAVNYSYVISGATNRSGNSSNASGQFSVGTSTITWTVTDNHNNSTTCQTTVLVNSPVISSVNDVYAVNPGGAANTLYIGYGPSSLTLNGNVSGGTLPYSYKWTVGSSAGPGLNNTSSYTVNPSSVTTYYFNVKDMYGCSATLVTKTVSVIDVRCGARLDKVTVCSVVKGHPATTCLAQKDVAAALASGSYLGSCINSALTVSGDVKEINRVLAVSVMPNPSANYFTIHVEGGDAKEKVTIRITDVLGRIIEEKTDSRTNSSLQIGETYRPGVYLAEIIQGQERKQLKLIKMKN